MKCPLTDALQPAWQLWCQMMCRRLSQLLLSRSHRQTDEEWVRAKVPNDGQEAFSALAQPVAQTAENLWRCPACNGDQVMIGRNRDAPLAEDRSVVDDWCAAGVLAWRDQAQSAPGRSDQRTLWQASRPRLIDATARYLGPPGFSAGGPCPLVRQARCPLVPRPIRCGSIVGSVHHLVNRTARA